MKRMLLLGFIACWPLSASAQTYVNPDTTQQSGDIYIQNTDVYYAPMAPPADTDTREGLSNLGDVFLDPNGVGSGYYHPTTHGVLLQNWAPSGDTLGPTARWQRFFTAKRDASGHTHDIIAGSNVAPPDTIIERGLDGFPNDTEIVTTATGPVIISKNEDVDFRASGRIKLKSGFHVMPGAFFHAYTEPKFDSVVFSDEFDSSTLDKSKWRVTNAHNDDYEFGAECSSDSDVRDTADPDAHDGHALDVILREVPDSCSCFDQSFSATDTCNDDFSPSDTATKRFAFSGAMLRSCPFPWVSRDSIPLVPVYAHSPYGKYEVREKIPHTKHHANNWEYDQFEYDMNEVWNTDMSQLHPGAGPGGFFHGPYKGVFGQKSLSDTTRVFRCSQANWCLSNFPKSMLVAGNFDFDIQCNLTPTDTFLTASGTTYNIGGFPISFSHSTDSISFYYRRQTNNIADSVTWHVSTDGGGVWRIFSAPHHVVGGDSLIFSKSYQPTSITLTNPLTSTQASFSCHWVDSLNDPHNYGKISECPR